MGKKKNKDLQSMDNDELRAYWLELIDIYQDMIKDVKKKSGELKEAIRETRKLMTELYEQADHDK